MAASERVEAMDTVKVRSKQADFFKVQMLARDIRVVIEPSSDKRGFFVSAQQYYPNCSYHWEVRPDGWRDTQTQWCGTLEGAKRTFDSMVRNESRFVESRKRR